MQFPLNNGICLLCADVNVCPMTEMLPQWQEIKAEYGDHIKELRPDLWNEYAIDEPDVADGEITWCPMQRQLLIISHAAIMRNDGVVITGKSHPDIIKISPLGTCKYGSEQGFVTNHGDFVNRKTAMEIAEMAEQIKPENIDNGRFALLSEDIWSDRVNGDWTYDEEKGYVLRD